MASAQADKSKPYFPLAKATNDGYNRDGEATATCYCGGIQMAFPIKGPGFFNSFVCNCSDCRVFTASMFASNFTIKDDYLKYNRGKELLKVYGPQSHTIASGNGMANHFCSECGTLMFRVSTGYPGYSIMRLGTVDDQLLVEKELKPQFEQFVQNRVDWLPGVPSIRQAEASGF